MLGRSQYKQPTLNININQKLKSTNQIYQINYLNSTLSGLTLGLAWSQNTYDYAIYNDLVYIDLRGSLNFDLFVDGVGTVYTSNKHYQMVVDTRTGEAIQIAKK